MPGVPRLHEPRELPRQQITNRQPIKGIFRQASKSSTYRFGQTIIMQINLIRMYIQKSNFVKKKEGSKQTDTSGIHRSDN